MASNQQPQPRGPQTGAGRPKLANIKPAVKPKTVPDGGPKVKEGKKAKGGKKLLIMILVVLVMAGGGFFAYRHWHRPAKGKPVAPVATSGPQATYTLKSLTVNLANTDSSHFVRIQVVLQYPQSNAALATELKDREYIIDDKIISDLRSKTYDDLATDKGEKALKQELMRTVNGVLTKGQVDGVYFDDFLIQ